MPCRDMSVCMWRKKLQGRQDSPDLQMQHKWTPSLPHIYDLKQSQKLFQDLYVQVSSAHISIFSACTARASTLETCSKSSLFAAMKSYQAQSDALERLSDETRSTYIARTELNSVTLRISIRSTDSDFLHEKRSDP